MTAEAIGFTISFSTMKAISDAYEAALVKHGELTADPVRGCAILIRECGEAMNEALLMTAPVKDASEMPNYRRQQMFDELAQVAATAMKIMNHLDILIRQETARNAK